MIFSSVKTIHDLVSRHLAALREDLKGHPFDVCVDDVELDKGANWLRYTIHLYSADGLVLSEHVCHPYDYNPPEGDL